MRIAFVGGKSSGKSTCAALFSRYLAAKGLPVLAVDAAADRRLGALLGCPSPPCWSAEHLGGAGGDRAAVPGDARRQGPFAAPNAAPVGARPVVVLGPDGLGQASGPPTCPSAPAVDGVHLIATDAVDLLLDHLADAAGEYVVIDLATGGVASPRYDLTVLVSEPTRRSVGLYSHHAAHVALRVLGNKISDWGGAAWLTEQTGDALVGCVGHSAWVRAAERGTAGSVSGLEPGNTAALAAVRAALDACPRKLQQGGPVSGHPAVVVEPAYSASRR
jgi:CO dehydrogenase maturation factor